MPLNTSREEDDANLPVEILRDRRSIAGRSVGKKISDIRKHIEKAGRRTKLKTLNESLMEEVERCSYWNQLMSTAAAFSTDEMTTIAEWVAVLEENVH